MLPKQTKNNKYKQTTRKALVRRGVHSKDQTLRIPFINHLIRIPTSTIVKIYLPNPNQGRAQLGFSWASSTTKSQWELPSIGR
jgi:hypothetical protein